MGGNTTFMMVKPSTFAAGFTGAILARIEENGFRIKAMKMVRMTLQQAQAFYEVHAARPFYDGLVSFMSSGPSVVAVLEKEDAVEAFRKLIGATNPADAAEGTIRKAFGASVRENAVHGSDSDENAAREAAFFFPYIERF